MCKLHQSCRIKNEWCLYFAVSYGANLILSTMSISPGESSPAFVTDIGGAINLR